MKTLKITLYMHLFEHLMLILIAQILAPNNVKDSTCTLFGARVRSLIKTRDIVCQNLLFSLVYIYSIYSSAKLICVIINSVIEIHLSIMQFHPPFTTFCFHFWLQHTEKSILINE